MAYVIYEYDWRNEYVKSCFYNGFYTFQGMKYAILVDIEEAKIYKNKKTALKAVERILEKTGFMAEVEEINGNRKTY